MTKWVKIKFNKIKKEDKQEETWTWAEDFLKITDEDGQRNTKNIDNPCWKNRSTLIQPLEYSK